MPLLKLFGAHPLIIQQLFLRENLIQHFSLHELKGGRVWKGEEKECCLFLGLLLFSC